MLAVANMYTYIIILLGPQRLQSNFERVDVDSCELSRHFSTTAVVFSNKQKKKLFRSTSGTSTARAPSPRAPTPTSTPTSPPLSPRCPGTTHSRSEGGPAREGWGGTSREGRGELSFGLKCYERGAGKGSGKGGVRGRTFGH